MTDKLKIVFSFLLFVAGIVGFYLLSDQALVLRILAILVGLGLAGLVFWKTALGQKIFGFINESIIEAKRVVWAIREGRQCARAVDEFLMGMSTLPR